MTFVWIVLYAEEKSAAVDLVKKTWQGRIQFVPVDSPIVLFGSGGDEKDRPYRLLNLSTTGSSRFSRLFDDRSIDAVDNRDDVDIEALKKALERLQESPSDVDLNRTRERLEKMNKNELYDSSKFICGPER